MKQPKKVLMVLMLIASLGSAAFSWNSVSAATIQSVNSRNVIARLSISNGTAHCMAVISGCDSGTQISGTMRLVKVTGTRHEVVGQWDLGSTVGRLNCNKTAKVAKGEYKLILSAVIVNGIDRETITKTSSANY